MTKRLALLVALMLANVAANGQAPRNRPAPAASAPTAPAAKPPAPSAAQTPPNPEVNDPAGFLAFTATPFYKDLVKRAINGIPPEMFERCPALVSNGSKITILRPLRLTDDFPVAGVWKHSFPVSGCGPDTILNFYFFPAPEKRISLMIGPPGTTRADPTLLHGARTEALAGAASALHDPGSAPCASYVVRDTKFEGYGLEDPPTPDPGPAEPLRPWRESWTVGGCGHTFLVPLNFAPLAAGGTEIKQSGHVVDLTQTEVAGAQSSPALPPPALPPPALPAPALPGAGVPPLAPRQSPEPALANSAAMPGSTHATLRQQREAEARTVSAAALVVQEQGGTPCPSYTVTDTKFEAFGLEHPPTPDPGPTAPERPWWESWKAAGCGRQFLVPLNFIPHGGVIDIVQPGHVTQPLLVDPSEIHNPYAKDDPPLPAAPSTARPVAKP